MHAAITIVTLRTVIARPFASTLYFRSKLATMTVHAMLADHYGSEVQGFFSTMHIMHINNDHKQCTLGLQQYIHNVRVSLGLRIELLRRSQPFSFYVYNTRSVSLIA